MRGFPLLSTALMMLFFALSWWPLRQLTGARPAPVAPDGLSGAPPAEAATPGLTLRFFASRPLSRLQVEHLGQPVLDLGPGEIAGDFKRHFSGLTLESGGIDFWVEAAFAAAPGPMENRAALAIEAAPADPLLEPRRVTLWAEAGDDGVADIVVFDWPGWEIGP